MRYLALACVTSLALLVSACGDDDGDGPSGVGGSVGEAGEAGSGARAGRGGSGGTGGSSSSETTFVDLPGKIRFVNHVSDGTAGVNLDLYWGVSIERGELVGTIEYGDITEFYTPRRSTDSISTTILDEDEARYFLVPEGETVGNASTFLVQDDQSFTADTVLTIALGASDSSLTDDLRVAYSTIDEAELSTPPEGMAHVYEWSIPFDHIADGDFVLVGAEGLCSPDRGEPGGANLGAPALIPAGATGVSVYDANTEPPCDSGPPPVSATIEAGGSYLLLAEAETYELEARRVVLLELGTER